ncbi:MAG: ATP synthase F1 subunit gamma [Candidatus Dependentiae bacterium]
MSQLIYLRQRIKAIETIKKITHAMRLISMSAHTRMRQQDDALKAYIKASSNLLKRVKYALPTWKNPLIEPSQKPQSRPLLILIGSQKGLCGNFNSSLLNFFFNNYKNLNAIDIIVVGKKMIDLVTDKNIKISSQYSDLHVTTLTTIAQEIVKFILAKEPSSVSLVSNQLKSFFVQKPHITHLIPVEEQIADLKPTEDYHWEQSPQEVLDNLLQQIIESQIQYILFQSLYAEQAARFLSMDNSTRNAQSLLDQTKLQYNKLRQAKITKELTELTGSNF